jgi:hypothetical protein
MINIHPFIWCQQFTVYTVLFSLTDDIIIIVIII